MPSGSHCPLKPISFPLQQVQRFIFCEDVSIVPTVLLAVTWPFTGKFTGKLCDVTILLSGVTQRRLLPKCILKSFQALQSTLTDLQKCIINGAVKFLSVRSSQGSLRLFEITRALVLVLLRQSAKLTEDRAAQECSKVATSRHPNVPKLLRHWFEVFSSRLMYPLRERNKK